MPAFSQLFCWLNAGFFWIPSAVTYLFLGNAIVKKPGKFHIGFQHTKALLYAMLMDSH
jgi:hypothetical protein